MEMEWNTKKAKILDLLSILIEEDNNTKQVAIEKVEELTKQNMMLEKENEALKNKLMGFEAAELMKTDNSKGDFYVYGFFNKEWNDWFYIGKGCHNRINETNGRNERIIAILNNYDCERRIIKDNLSEKDALLLEKDTKIKFMLQGKPIVDYEKTWSAFRQKQGIEKAKKAGKYKGGRCAVKVDTFLFEKEYNRLYSGEITKSEFAKILHVSRPTLNKLLREYSENKLIERTQLEHLGI